MNTFVIEFLYLLAGHHQISGRVTVNAARIERVHHGRFEDPSNCGSSHNADGPGVETARSAAFRSGGGSSSADAR